MSDPGETFRTGLVALALGGIASCGAVGFSRSATEETQLVERLKTMPLVPLADLPAHDGSDVAVQGWAGGVWPTEVGGEQAPVPVLHCETHRHKPKCDDDDPRPDEECAKRWYRVDGRTPPAIVLQATRPSGDLGEAPAVSVRVELAQARLPALERLAEGKDWYLLCLRADRELTVFGELSHGVIRSGTPFVVGALPREELIGAAEREGPVAQRKIAWGLGVAAALLIALGLGAMIWALRQ